MCRARPPSGARARRSSQGCAAAVAFPARTSGGRPGRLAASRSYASSRPPTFFLGSRVPKNRTYPPSAGGRSRGAHAGAPGEHTEIRSKGHAELPLDFARGELRDDDHAVRSARVPAGERLVVTPDLCARTLGMGQKVEIVDRDDLGGVPGREKKRMKRVRDVESPTGQRLGSRPAEAMPRQVQQASRHAAIDNGRADKIGRRLEAILPRAGEERQIERTAWRGRRKCGEQGADEFVRVFADAAPLLEGRPVVDENAHLGDVTIGVLGSGGLELGATCRVPRAVS